jgi:hypothetical protein
VLNVDLLLRSGAIEGPFRRARPLTLTLWRRIRRLVRRLQMSRLRP